MFISDKARKEFNNNNSPRKQTAIKMELKLTKTIKQKSLKQRRVLLLHFK